MCFLIETVENIEFGDGFTEFVGFGVDELDDARGDFFVPFLCAFFSDSGLC